MSMIQISGTRIQGKRTKAPAETGELLISNMKLGPEIYLDKRGFPFCFKTDLVQEIVTFGLKPGAQVVQIGILAKSGKQTSASRIQEFEKPVIYRGRVYDKDGPFIAFEYEQDGEILFILYRFSTSAKEIYLINERTASIRIHKAVFKCL